MTMHGIDISNWQAGLQISKLDVDFVICKATEGLSFVDKYCDGWISHCKKNGIPFGFYHFARENDPRREAEFFYDQCRGYIKAGIPVLDYEVENSNNHTWCEKFLRRFHDLSGIWPLLYISASRCSEYEGSWIPSKCGLWLAGYPRCYTEWISAHCPYNVAPWDFAAIWQFTSSLKLSGYNADLDGNLAYMSVEAWAKYAGANMQPEPKPKPKPTTKPVDDLVRETLQGLYGTDQQRKDALGSRYDDVQKRINELYSVAEDVLKGKWGNGWNRKQALEGAGYPYDIVQDIVNDLVMEGYDYNGC